MRAVCSKRLASRFLLLFVSVALGKFQHVKHEVTLYRIPLLLYICDIIDTEIENAECITSCLKGLLGTIVGLGLAKGLEVWDGPKEELNCMKREKKQLLTYYA